MKPRILILLVTLTSFINAQVKTSNRMVELKVSGGETVKCEVSDKGPLPAQSGPYKMEVSGMMLDQDEDGRKLSLKFTFGIRASTPVSPTHIVIEDVTGINSVRIVEDKSPKFENNYWRGDATPLVVSKMITPWVFDKKVTVKVYRVTISTDGEKRCDILSAIIIRSIS